MSKLGNISTRADVGTDDNVVIAGFILGNATGETGLIIRGLGPSLALLAFRLRWQIRRLSCTTQMETLVQANNDWQEDPAQAAEVAAAGLAPSDAKESAMSVLLSAGNVHGHPCGTATAPPASAWLKCTISFGARADADADADAVRPRQLRARRQHHRGHQRQLRR